MSGLGTMNTGVEVGVLLGFIKDDVWGDGMVKVGLTGSKGVYGLKGDCDDCCGLEYCGGW